jgi:hypothetical protein
MVMHPPIERLAEHVTFLVPHVQEIVIVDTGSSDEDIAKMESWNYKDGSAEVRVIHRNFVNFSHTRNQGLAEHRFEWTFGLDPDELPSWEMLRHMKEVTNPDAAVKYKSVQGWLYLSLNWWDGVLGPVEPYHWHVRLWRTRRSWMYRPIHELMMLGGQSEGSIRGRAELPKAPEGAYLIHSKSGRDIVHSDNLYKNMGGKSSL